MLGTIETPALQDVFRDQLRGLYGNLKKMDSYIQFAFLTGVTRFGKLSIFSDLNNLNDISMTPEFSAVCGVTDDELHRYFDDGIRTMASERQISAEQVYDDLKANYDGYHFCEDGGVDIYNPFSVLKALQERRIKDYWFETGTPMFLIKMIRNRKLPLHELDEIEEPVSSITNVSFDMTGSIAAVMYQTGYLTIKGHENYTGMLRLGFPNKEVERGFLLQLMKVYVPHVGEKSWADIVAFWRDVMSGDVQAFMTRLQNLYADFNSDGFTFVNLEQHYQDIPYLGIWLLYY